MVLRQIVSQIFLLSIICTCLNAADSFPPFAGPVNIEPAATEPAEDEALPASPVRAISSAISDAEFNSLHHPRIYAGCKVTPLSDIYDREAVEFEKNAMMEIKFGARPPGSQFLAASAGQ